MADESVGAKFNEQYLQAARDRTLEVILEAAREVRPGMTERQAKAIVKRIQTEKGCAGFWHAPQIRFGENTLQPFGKGGRGDVVLRKDDIFFFDLGPLFEEHEGDVGRSFAVGSDPEMHRCAEDAEKIFFDVRDEWRRTGASGQVLYEFAEECARKRGWTLITHGASGHRVADFPHTARRRGNIAKLSHRPAADRWILEIQIRHPTRPFGAFYEDLLN